MSTVSAPYGLRPIRSLNGKFIAPPRAIPGGIASGYASTISLGDPVKLTTNPATGVLNIGATTGDIYGVFAGVQYVPSNTGLLTPTIQWVGGTTYVAGSCIVYVWDDPEIIYQIQSNGSIPASAIGAQANIVNPGGTANNGVSPAQISSTLVGYNTQGQLSIRGIAFNINNTAGDAYTDVEVQIASNQFVADKVSL